MFKNGFHFLRMVERVEDDPRPELPITALTKENILAVREIKEENPYSTFDQIETLTPLHPPSIYSIIHDHLGLRKIISRFVPYELSAKYYQDKVRICEQNLV